MTSQLATEWAFAGGSHLTHWNFATIEELLAHSKGIAVGVMYPGDYTVGGTPLVRVSDIDHGEIRGTPEFMISGSVDYEYRRTRLEGNELLITLVGNPGECVVVDSKMEGWNVARAIAVVRLSDPKLRYWIKYVLESGPGRHLVETRLNTTVQKTLNLKEIRALGFPIPSGAERDAIINVIQPLNDKIELNRQNNKTLEDIAKAIFKSWFVDFDPVYYKRDGRVPNASEDTQYSLSPEILDLFPDSFQDSELGEIPVGWTTGSLLVQANLHSGGTPKTSFPEYWGGNILWASAKDVSQCGETFLLTPEKTITQEGLDCSSTKLIEPLSTVIVARGATTGRMVMFGDQMAMNQTCYALTSKSDSPFYLHGLVENTIASLLNSAHGSVFDTITTKTFESISVVQGTDNLAAVFDTRVRSLYMAVLSNQKEIATLGELRDTLLPKLISGELPIKNAEKFLEQAGV